MNAHERHAVQVATQDALKRMFDANQALRALGWHDPMHAPCDGSTLLAVQAASTGIHEVHRDPDGSWWAHDEGDLWPYHPTLWKAKS